MDKELKPCPFCGEKGYLHKELLRKRFGVFCGGCLTQTCFFDDQEEARVAWNRRVNNDNGTSTSTT